MRRLLRPLSLFSALAAMAGLPHDAAAGGCCKQQADIECSSPSLVFRTLARTNGVPTTIKGITSIGGCDCRIKCVAADGLSIGATETRLGVGESLHSFSCGGDATSIGLFSAGSGDGKRAVRFVLP